MNALPEGDRAAWLHDLRSDAPQVANALESLLLEGGPARRQPAARTSFRALRALLAFARP